MAYLNFVIDLTELPDGSYSISVLSSPVGEVSAVVPNPFTPAEIDAAVSLLEDSATAQTLEQSHAARQLGQQLFQFLIRQNGDINSAYFASLDRAGSDGLRLRLSVEHAGVLAGLPWELLADPNRDFLALSRSTPLTRYTQQLMTRPPVPVILPLRVLVMISAPRDLPTLDVEDEWQRLNEATATLQARGLLELERLEQATLIALQRRLRAEDYHVFHYIGHSAYNDTTGSVLALEHEDDALAQLVPGAALARELGEETTIRLVVLNSCESGQADGQHPFLGIASSLVTRGIPAVVAMQHSISDAAATVFAEEFYRALAETLPIDSALNEARRAIANRLHSLEWAIPALYMRSEDGVLFRQTPVDARRLPPTTLLGLALAGLLLLFLLAGPVHTALAPPPTPTVALLADLEIVSVRSSPVNPAPGEAFRLLIGIRNAGDADSGPFSWVWDASPARLNALDGRIDTIPPGATYNLSFPFSYGWWGSYSSQIVVDADSEVVESNERNNREAAIIELDNGRAFMVDFTLLPSNEIVTPPLTLDADAFALWNLHFGLSGEACAATPLRLIDAPPRLLLTADAEAGDCANAPLEVGIGQPVSRMSVVVAAGAAGTAQLTLYADDAGTEIVYESAAVPVSAGQTVLLGPGGTLERPVRRAVVAVSGQAVQVSKVTLYPVGG
jgi:CHAT domain-containing protein